MVGVGMTKDIWIGWIGVWDMTKDIGIGWEMTKDIGMGWEMTKDIGIRRGMG